MTLYTSCNNNKIQKVKSTECEGVQAAERSANSTTLAPNRASWQTPIQGNVNMDNETVHKFIHCFQVR